MKRIPTRYPLLLFCLLSLFLLTVLLSACGLSPLTDGYEEDEGANTVISPVTDPPGEAPHTTTVTEPPVTATTAPVSTAAPTTPPVTTSPAPILYFNPLSGLPCDGQASSARPLAFCIKEAAGNFISTADVVIEAPTEATATRLMLLGTSHTEIFTALTIASARPYMAALANDFFAVSIFRGTSDRDRESATLLYDTVDLTETATNTPEELRDVLTSNGIQTGIAGSIALPYRFAAVGESIIPSTAPSTYVSVSFSQGATSSFTYDPLTRCYTMRSCKAMLQDSTELPSFANLLILFHDATERVTKDGTELVLDTGSGGSGYYVSGGQMMPILWRRDPATSSLILTDGDGVPLTVNRGKTYVAMTSFAYREGMVLN